jgi:hypothetical protein
MNIGKLNRIVVSNKLDMYKELFIQCGQGDHIDRERALKLIQHISSVFKFNASDLKEVLPDEDFDCVELKDELAIMKNVLGKLIAWSSDSLGKTTTTTLLNELNSPLEQSKTGNK